MPSLSLLYGRLGCPSRPLDTICPPLHLLNVSPPRLSSRQRLARVAKTGVGHGIRGVMECRYGLLKISLMAYKIPSEGHNNRSQAYSLTFLQGSGVTGSLAGRMSCQGSAAKAWEATCPARGTLPASPSGSSPFLTQEKRARRPFLFERVLGG